MDQSLPSYILTIAITAGGYLLALVLIPRILLDRRGAEATLAWILLIAFLPYLGAFLYFALGRTRIRRKARKKLLTHSTVQNRLTTRLPPGNAVTETTPHHQELPPVAYNIARLAYGLTDAPLTPGNSVDVFIGGEPTFENMIQAIREARHHVFLMSYIFRRDNTGREFLDLLAQKAAEGLTVRLLVDGIGGSEIGGSFVRPLIEAGGRFAHFGPILSSPLGGRLNLRNHRKILVVDGQIGFTGGLNIGDEYGDRSKRFFPWRDTHMRLEGPAVRSLQEVFAEDWLHVTGEDLILPEFFPDIPMSGRDFVQIISSGPDHDQATIQTVFFTAINEARQEVLITTPYYIPDPAILMALKAASWRGIDVKILLPGKSELPLVQCAGRSYYEESLIAGIKLYEHRPGFLHAKTMVVDGIWTTIGSANMDIRSFKLNYEVNAMIWGSAFAERMKAVFLKDLSTSEPVTLEALSRKRKRDKMAESICRVLSPVL